MKFAIGSILIGVRLVGANSTLQGRLELRDNGVWGTVCSDVWSMNEANVVCRQLGYDGAVAAPRFAAYGQGTGKVWVKQVKCTGNESSLMECTNVTRPTSCPRHRDEVGVACTSKVRITGGLSAREGLVQVYHNNTWGWVCADQWDKRDADVVCRELGYNGASTLYNSPARGGDTIWMNKVQCNGNESSLLLCAHDGWRNHSCRNQDAHAGVVCIGAEVRLVSGNVASSAGRVEMLMRGFWGTVCDLGRWDLSDANMVCRQLGYEKAVVSPRRAAFGKGTGIIWDNYIQCNGDEATLAGCNNGSWSSFSCDHESDVGAVCTPRVRLIEKHGVRWEGLVQVYHNKTWGWVCADQWDKRDADVVCRELGYTGSTAIYSDDTSVNGNNTIWMRKVKCVGSERSLYSCFHNGWKNERCGKGNKMAGVVCAGPEVRTFGGNSPLDGFVEVLFKGVWVSICRFNSWGLREAIITCRQLGYQTASRSYCNCQQNLQVVRLLDDLRCIGNESSVFDCSYRLTSSRLGRCRYHSLYYDNDASVSCRSQAASVGQPLFVFSTFDSIIIQWTPVKSANYTVKIWNNDTNIWEDSSCSSSFVNDCCVVNDPRAVMTGLTPLSVYYFKVFVHSATSSQPSDPMRTKDNDSPGKPFFVGSTVDTITIGWLPVTLDGAIYFVQMKTDKDISWQNASCTESLLSEECIVNTSFVTVTSVKRYVTILFRVYYIFKGALSDASLPSDPLTTAVLSLGKPQFVSTGLDYIILQWNSSTLSTNYTVQMWSIYTMNWEHTNCRDSIAVRYCLVTSSRAIVTELKPSSVYYFRVNVTGANASPLSDAIKTKAVDTPGKPFFVGSTVDTITIGWPPVTLDDAIYFVQMKTDKNILWQNASCTASLLSEECMVNTSSASVTSVKKSVTILFRVYAIFKGVWSDASVPSDPLQTTTAKRRISSKRYFDVEQLFVELTTCFGLFILPSQSFGLRSSLARSMMSNNTYFLSEIVAWKDRERQLGKLK